MRCDHCRENPDIRDRSEKAVAELDRRADGSCGWERYAPPQTAMMWISLYQGPTGIYADGSRDRNALLEDLAAHLESGSRDLYVGSFPVPETLHDLLYEAAVMLDRRRAEEKAEAHAIRMMMMRTAVAGRL